MVYVPFGRWLPFGARSKPEPHLRTATNVYPLTGGGYAPWPALADAMPLLSDTFLPAAAIDAMGVEKPGESSLNQPLAVVVGTSTKLYMILDTGSTARDATRSVGGDYATPTPGSSSFGGWQFAQHLNQIFATNLVDDVQARPNTFGASGSAMTDRFAALAGSPPKARCICSFGDFLVLGGLNDGGADEESALHWSAAGDTTGWTPGTDLSDRRTFARMGRLTGLSADRGSLYVYFTTGILRGVFVGPPQIIRFDEIWRGPGPESPFSICSGDGREFWLQTRGVFERIGDSINQIDEEERIHGLYQLHPMLRGVVNTLRDHVAFFFNTIGIDQALIFNYHERRWSLEDSYGLNAPFRFPDRNSVTMGAGGNIGGFTTDTHQFVQIGGSAAATATFETSDIVDKETGRRLGVRAVRPDCGGSATVALAKRETEGASVTFGTAVATGASGRASIRANGRYLNAQVKIAPGTFSPTNAALGLELELTEGGRGKR